MIRPITCVAAVLACASGYYVYYGSHQVSLLDRQIEQTVHQSTVTRERIRMLHAEWTVLNRPERLQRLADQYLSLQPTKPDQFVSMAGLASRLPPPVAPVAGPDLVAGSAPAAGADQVAVAAGGGGAGNGLVVAAGTGLGVTGTDAPGNGAVETGPVGNGSAAGDGAERAAAAAGAPVPAATLAVRPPATGAAVPTPAQPVPVGTVRLAAAPPRPVPHPIVEAARRPGHSPAAGRAAAPPPPRPRLMAAALHVPSQSRSWAPPRPAAARLVPAGYRAAAYRPPPATGGSMLGMAHTYVAGPLVPPAPMPMPTGNPGGGG